MDIIPASKYKGKNGNSEHYPERRHHGFKCNRHLYEEVYLTEVWVGFVNNETFVFLHDRSGPDFILPGRRTDDEIWAAVLAWIDGCAFGYQIGIGMVRKKLAQLLKAFMNLSNLEIDFKE